MHAYRYRTSVLAVALVGLGGWVLHDAVGASTPSAVASGSEMAPGESDADARPLRFAVTGPGASPTRLLLLPTSSRQGAPSPSDERSQADPRVTMYVLPGGQAAASTTSDGATGQPLETKWSGATITHPVFIDPGAEDEDSPNGPPAVASGHQVLAADGAIVYIGENGRLTANTGPTGSSGVVALGVRRSTLRSGRSSNPAPAPVADDTVDTDTPAPGLPPTSDDGQADEDETLSDDLSGFWRDAPLVDDSNDGEDAAPTDEADSNDRENPAPTDEADSNDEANPAPTDEADSNDVQSPHANQSFLSLLPPPGQDGRSIALSGFEDHSVSVLGNDQIVTYDDSNVFVARNGTINANTGDTDSSGLNAVDVMDSLVRAGNSGDGEGNDDEVEEEEEAASPAPRLRRQRRFQAAAAPATRTPRTTAPSTPSSDDEDEAGNDEAAEDAGFLANLGSAGPLSTVTDEGASAATGPNNFVVGADGFDDVSIRSQGDGNVVSYDDSNVVIGGTGKVNAQIGDSDTGGAVVMGIRRSDVRAGCEGDLCYSPRPRRR
jgi:hypothetical protein